MRATYAKKYNEEPNIYDSNSGAPTAWVSRPRWCMQLCVRRNAVPVGTYRRMQRLSKKPGVGDVPDTNVDDWLWSDELVALGTA